MFQIFMVKQTEMVIIFRIFFKDLGLMTINY